MYLRSIFDNFDSDGDGKLNVQELEGLMQHLGHSEVCMKDLVVCYTRERLYMQRFILSECRCGRREAGHHISRATLILARIRAGRGTRRSDDDARRVRNRKPPENNG